jgi:hypothetical protein
VLGAFTPGVKQLGHKDDHSLLSSAKGKNGGALPPLPNTSSWGDASLIEHRDNFIFYL